jgi:hypothetical protein
VPVPSGAVTTSRIISRISTLVLRLITRTPTGGDDPGCRASRVGL